MTSSLPTYVDVAPHECGVNFGVSFEDYRMLARTALSVTQRREATMGIYPLRQGDVL